MLDMDPEDAPEEGAAFDLDMSRKGQSAVIKTSTRQTVFLPVVGLVPASELKPSDLVGVNKDSYLILDKLPAEYVPATAWLSGGRHLHAWCVCGGSE